MAKTWFYSGDINVLSYGGLWIRKVGPKRFHVVEFTNMDDACGRDNEGQDPYVVELAEVDLTTANMESAAASFGLPSEIYDHQTHVYSNDPRDQLALVEACYRYGCKAPLGSWSGRNGHEMIREAKRESRALESDPVAYEDKMNRPVNAIGSTAREYQANDLSSAILRGLEAGDPKAEILVKMGCLK